MSAWCGPALVLVLARAGERSETESSIPGSDPRSDSRPALRSSRRWADRPSPGRAIAREPCRRAFRPGRSIGMARAGRRPVAGQVEVEEQRIAIGGQQDVGRLDVSVGHVAAKRVVECLGQPGADPRDRLTVGKARQDFTSRPRRVNGRKLGSGDGVKVREQVDPRSRASVRSPAQPPGQRPESPPPERHADQVESVIVDPGVGDDLDDVGMPHPRQEPRLAGHSRRHLEHDQAILEVGLLGQKYAGETAAPQLATQDDKARSHRRLPVVNRARASSPSSGPEATAGTRHGAESAARAPSCVVETGRGNRETSGLQPSASDRQNSR